MARSQHAGRAEIGATCHVDQIPKYHWRLRSSKHSSSGVDSCELEHLPDGVDSCSEESTFFSQNTMCQYGNLNKENIPWHGNLFFVYEGLPHVMRTLLWETCSHSLDCRTNTCYGMGLPTSGLQPPLRAPLFQEVNPRSCIKHAFS